MRTEAREGLSPQWQEEKPVGITSHAFYAVHVDIRHTSSRRKVLPIACACDTTNTLKTVLCQEKQLLFHCRDSPHA